MALSVWRTLAEPSVINTRIFLFVTG